MILTTEQTLLTNHQFIIIIIYFT